MTLPDGPVLLVSPHLDDAALSCAALVARTEPIDVLTVFTGRPVPPRSADWDRACGFADSDEAVSARLDEERAAFADTPHRLVQLDLLEAQYLDDPRAPGDAVALGRFVTGWIGRLEGTAGTVALPACAGRVYHGLERVVGTPRGERRALIKRLAGRPGRALLSWVNRRLVLRDDPVVHGDHRFVRDAVLDALAGTATPVLLYEEVPYLWGQPADDEVARTAGRRGLRATPLTVTVDRAAKARRVAEYRSQVPHLFCKDGKPLDTPDGLPARERYWLLRPDPTTIVDAKRVDAEPDGHRAPPAG